MNCVHRINGLVLTLLLFLGSLSVSSFSQADSNLNQSPADIKTTTFETCFSPHEPCDQKLIAYISKATTSLDIAIYSITHQGIADVILAKKNSGLKVRMIVDRTQSKGRSSLVDSLVSSGISLKIGNFSGIMHDKFTIVDGKYLETGSYNYTANATSNNGENQLYLDDQTVIQRYSDNYETMWNDALSPQDITPSNPSSSH